MKEIKEKIESANEIIVISHERPDGDAIGSALAMGLGLEKLGKRVRIFVPDRVPEVYRFLKGIEKIEKLQNTKELHADVCVFLDTANPIRLGSKTDLRGLGKLIVNIDHHVDNTGFGDINLIDPTAAATGEIVYEVLSQWDDLIDPDIADALYTAIVTDSGRFSYDSTTHKTHLIAADLLMKGANKSKIIKNIYEIKPLKVLKLIGEMLINASLAFDGKVIWSFITLKSFREHGADLLDSEGFLQFLRMTQGAKIAILFRELEENRIRVSLRSIDSSINVREIAAEFGGGGHDMAAGCTLETDLEGAKNLILKSIKEKYAWKE